MHSSFLATSLAILAAGTLAADQYSDDDFRTRVSDIYFQNAPMWHFATGSCLPEAAETNGQQTNGNEPGGDVCVLKNIPAGCPALPDWQGPKTPIPVTPTYVTAKHCTGDDSWRLTYSLYFRHDSGHESDWEFISIVFKRGPDNFYFRDHVILQQDNENPSRGYGDFDSFADPANPVDGQHNENHIKVYVSKYHHSMHHDIFRGNKNNCAEFAPTTFRVDDYQMYSGDNLRDGSVVPVEWDWGKAVSAPLVTIQDGNKQDICGR